MLIYTQMLMKTSSLASPCAIKVRGKFVTAGFLCVKRKALT